MIRVLFVCLGNICRSPMAEAVFCKMVQQENLSSQIEVDSAGIGNWHVGEPPHQGTQSILNKYQISFEGIKSRQITKEDLDTFDYIVAMDDKNQLGIEKLGNVKNGEVLRLLDLVENLEIKNVPDPYFTGDFDSVYQLVVLGCERLMQKIKAEKIQIS